MKTVWLLPLCLVLLLAACSSGDTNPPPTSGKGVVNGLVTDSGTGARLAGVQVTAAGKTATTDASGQFSLSGLPTGTVQLSFALENYAPGYANAEVGDQATPALVTLKQQGALQDYNTTQSATIYQSTEAGPYAVIFEPNSLDTTDTDLRVSVTPLDPTKEAAALPGELVTSNAILSPLTFAEFSIFDSAGNRVNLKPGQSAVVELPIPVELRARYSMGQVIHCYSYNPETGQWEDFVDGRVTTSSIDGTTPVIMARIKHFSWYGAAPESDDCIDVYVKIVSAVDGRPLSGARVEAFPGTATTTDADGFAHIVTVAGGPTHYTASKTYIDTDGSVSGMPGAKVIEFGEVDIELPGLVQVPCNSTSTKALAPSDKGEQADPLEIKIGYIGLASYQVTGWLVGTAGSGAAVVSLYEVDPEGNVGADVTGANIALVGPDGTVDLTDLGFGSYQADVSITPGARYTLNLDVDGNGSQDASGSVFAVGNIAWVQPTDGATLSADGLVAQWSDSAAGPDTPYSVLYYATLVGDQADGGDFAYYIGSDREFPPHHLGNSDPATQQPLLPGHYTGTLWAFSGPYDTGSQDYALTDNIKGVNVSGQFFSYTDISPVIEFNLE